MNKTMKNSKHRLPNPQRFARTIIHICTESPSRDYEEVLGRIHSCLQCAVMTLNLVPWVSTPEQLDAFIGDIQSYLKTEWHEGWNTGASEGVHGNN